MPDTKSQTRGNWLHWLNYGFMDPGRVIDLKFKCQLINPAKSFWQS